MKINLTKPTIGKAELKVAAEVLKSGWLIRGPHTSAFEQEFADFSGAKYSIATNGCTMALYLAVKSLNLKSTDEVIVPSLTWSATASIVIQAGAKGFEKFPVPILYDSAHRVAKKGFDGVTSCYSFFPVKNMTTVRGGMLLTNDENIAD